MSEKREMKEVIDWRPLDIPGVKKESTNLGVRADALGEEIEGYVVDFVRDSQAKIKTIDTKDVAGLIKDLDLGGGGEEAKAAARDLLRAADLYRVGAVGLAIPKLEKWVEDYGGKNWLNVDWATAVDVVVADKHGKAQLVVGGRVGSGVVAGGGVGGGGPVLPPVVHTPEAREAGGGGYWLEMTKAYSETGRLREATSKSAMKINDIIDEYDNFAQIELRDFREGLFTLHDFAREVDVATGFNDEAQDLQGRARLLSPHLGQILGLKDSRGEFVVARALEEYDGLAREAYNAGRLFDMDDPRVRAGVLRTVGGSDLALLAQMVARDIYGVTGGADRYGYAKTATKPNMDNPRLFQYEKFGSTNSRHFLRSVLNFKKSLVGRTDNIPVNKREFYRHLDLYVESFWETVGGRWIEDEEGHVVLTYDNLVRLSGDLGRGDLRYQDWFKNMASANDTKNNWQSFVDDPNNIKKFTEVLTKGYNNEIPRRKTEIAEIFVRDWKAYNDRVGYGVDRKFVKVRVASLIDNLIKEGALDLGVAKKLKAEFKVTDKELLDEIKRSPDYIQGIGGAILGGVSDFVKLLTK